MADFHTDPRARARMRWRARRGLLENDVLITRFLDRYEHTLTDNEVTAFCELLELSDRDLLDIILSDKALEGKSLTPDMLELLARLRAG